MRYSIPEFNIETLEKKLTRIRNKCAKYGCEFKYERVGEHFEEHRIVDEMGEFGEVISSHKEVIRFIDVETEGTARINGWRFAASLEFTEKGNIIKGTGELEIPERYYSCSPWCEHCKKAVDRRRSFIVFNEESGEFKQVGKSCLRDYTGGLSAESAASVESWIKELETASDFREYRGGFKDYYDVKKFMSYAAETIRLYGYAKNDGYGIISTTQRARELFEFDGKYGRMSKDAMDRVDAAKSKGFNAERPESTEIAAKVAEWIVGNEKDDNYYHNLKVACSLKYCDRRTLGLLTSAFPAFNRELEYEAERRAREAKAAEEAARSAWVGEIGKRVSFKPVSVACVTSWETMYGLIGIYKMEDEEGHVFTWKTGNWVDQELPVLKITGTIKEHKEYRGVKQTELTRCRIEYGKKPEKQPTKEELEANAKAMAAIDKALDELCCA